MTSQNVRIKKRPMKAVTLRIPEDVIEDLKFMADRLDFAGYQALMRAYISQGLRKDLEKIPPQDYTPRFIHNLLKLGVKPETIEKAQV